MFPQKCYTQKVLSTIHFIILFVDMSGDRRSIQCEEFLISPYSSSVDIDSDHTYDDSERNSKIPIAVESEGQYEVVEAEGPGRLNIVRRFPFMNIAMVATNCEYQKLNFTQLLKFITRGVLPLRYHLHHSLG